MSRKIIVVSTTKTTPSVIYSTSRTWGQLQNEISGTFGNVSSMRAVVKETKNDLSSSEAVLPEGDFTLFLTPKQIKAGFGVDVVSVLRALQTKWNDAIEEIIEEVEEGAHTTSVATAVSRASTAAISSEDMEMLRKIQAGQI